MRLITILCVLPVLIATLASAQPLPALSIKAPAAGSPGTSTPQPYAPVVLQPVPDQTNDNPPLLRNPVQPESARSKRDQDLLLLEEQRARTLKPKGTVKVD
ncbi:hypothetical protein OU997_19100 [Pseudomonas sp. SL4(2022)]|uniref:hypothetical protein n=1 Tax=unclassified Pseudomonas TaxID=196821 RepID=UPI0011B28B8F|nr:MULTISPECIES: hypothetical protein [unclassified Pseudomonas]WAC44314.1 hypothetical protein OU997_19100 [Pseudomonas sp. SL4(2022)]